MQTITIHLGLHKAGSTFLQKVYFPLFNNELFQYVDLRSQQKLFLRYLLFSNDFEFDSKKAQLLFNHELEITSKNPKHVIISDEQFCGSPWDNAVQRKAYFDRLNLTFPYAKYMLILRNEVDMVQSLYLQYIKKGGSAHWKEFLSHYRHPLAFGIGSYLNYSAYVNYILSKVGQERFGCFYFERFKDNPVSFLTDLSIFIGKTDFEFDQLLKISKERKNIAMSATAALFLRYLNKFCRSQRQPFLFLPRVARRIILRFLSTITFSRNRKIIPSILIQEKYKEIIDANQLLCIKNV